MTIDPSPVTPSSSNSPDASISRDAALTYWTSIAADVNGMLGGYPQVSRIDIQGSSNFLAKLQRLDEAGSGRGGGAGAGRGNRGRRIYERAADCGAGIGRITLNLLVHHAKVVDVVEPVKKFTDALVVAASAPPPSSIPKTDASAPAVGEVGRIYNLGLEDWDPCDRAGEGEGKAEQARQEDAAAVDEAATGTPAEAEAEAEAEADTQPSSNPTYDLIWNQWCLGQLTDRQLVSYLRRCARALLPHGWIIVKENMSSHVSGEDIFDETDSSVTRSDASFRRLFEEAGLVVVLTEVQRGMPRELFPVRCYGLRPRGWK